MKEDFIVSEKKGLWASLFGSKCSCGMTVEEDKPAERKKRPEQESGCCGMKIVENDSANGKDDTGL